jgi:hypothetical protein
MQATGEVVLDNERCERCQGGGSYDLCVVMREPELARHTSGACAGCWYNRNGCRCSIRSTYGRHRKRREGYLPEKDGLEATVTVAAGPVMAVPAPAPAPPAVAPAPAPAAAVMPTPVPERLSIPLQSFISPAVRRPAPVTVPAPIPTPAAPSPVDSVASRDAKITAWEERYSKMALQQLIEGQRHLLDRQDDLNMRLLAMNRALKSRVGSAEQRIASGRTMN